MKRDSKLDKAHEAIFAEFDDYRRNRTHDPETLRKHMTRLRQLTDAKMRIAFPERGK